jgi:FAD/FMN-containing dehydrogenase
MGGGPGGAGPAVCNDGIVIDLSAMRSVAVDPQSRMATVGGGALLSDVDRETQKYGLAVPAGVVSHTGIGGLALGGGFGWISRRHGLSVDNMRGAEVVTADGRIVRATTEENPDLFWALRGGGGNFGVVTSFQFKSAPIGTTVYSGVIAKPFDDVKRYMQFHRDFVRRLPDDMTVWLVIRPAPPLPFLPPGVHGKLIVLVPFAWLGDPDRGAQLIEPVRTVTPSVGEHIGETPWLTWQSLFDPLAGHGARNYWKSHHLQNLSDRCIDRIVEFAGRLPSPECEIFIPHMEGTPARVADDATAYGYRHVPFVMNIHTRWQNAADDQRCMTWARAFHDSTREFAEGVYVNFMGQEGDERVKDAYLPAVWQRLVEVKNRWDPQNVFRMNQNIKESIAT